MADLTTKAAEIRAGLVADEFEPPETMSPQDTARDLIERFRSGDCPFCGHDPYHYVDNGVGMERVAVTCCDLGIALFQDGDEQLSRASGERHEAANALSDLLALIEQQAAELAEARERLAAKISEVAGLQQSPLFKLKEDMRERAEAAESERDELLREKERLGAGWLPIETAPKDGTHVLLWSRYCSNPCVCEFRNGQWAVMADGVRAVEHMSDFGTDYHVFDVPSHWMPLPLPPEGSGQNLADAHSKSPDPSSQSERIAEAIAAEREACAKLVAVVINEMRGSGQSDLRSARARIENAIRARETPAALAPLGEE